jgi:hypothetical protein
VTTEVNGGHRGPSRTCFDTFPRLAEKTVPTVGEGNEEKLPPLKKERKSFPPLKKELKKVNKVVNMKSRGKLGIDSGSIGRGSGEVPGRSGQGRRGRGQLLPEKKVFLPC